MNPTPSLTRLRIFDLPETRRFPCHFVNTPLTSLFFFLSSLHQQFHLNFTSGAIYHSSILLPAKCFDAKTYLRTSPRLPSCRPSGFAKDVFAIQFYEWWMQTKILLLKCTPAVTCNIITFVFSLSCLPRNPCCHFALSILLSEHAWAVINNSSCLLAPAVTPAF